MAGQNEVRILTEVGENQEALECRSADAGTAFRAGQRECRKYQAMGFACECVGVVAFQDVYHGQAETSVTLAAGYGMVKRATREVHGTVLHTHYRPVVTPALTEKE